MNLYSEKMYFTTFCLKLWIFIITLLDKSIYMVLFETEVPSHCSGTTSAPKNQIHQHLHLKICVYFQNCIILHTKPFSKKFKLNYKTKNNRPMEGGEDHATAIRIENINLHGLIYPRWT